jgi:hypothetical protein
MGAVPGFTTKKPPDQHRRASSGLVQKRGGEWRLVAAWDALSEFFEFLLTCSG